MGWSHSWFSSVTSPTPPPPHTTHSRSRDRDPAGGILEVIGPASTRRFAAAWKDDEPLTHCGGKDIRCLPQGNTRRLLSNSQENSRSLDEELIPAVSDSTSLEPLKQKESTDQDARSPSLERVGACRGSAGIPLLGRVREWPCRERYAAHLLGFASGLQL